MRRAYGSTSTRLGVIIPLLVWTSLVQAAPPDAPPVSVVSVLVDEQALGGAHDVELAGDFAYVAGKAGTLTVVDVADPARPRIVWSMHDPVTLEDSETVLPQGDHLFVGTCDFLSFDIRDRSQPLARGALVDRPRIDRINGMVRIGDLILAANKSGWIDAFDVSRPEQPALYGALDVATRDRFASPHDIALLGDLAVIVDAAGFGRDDQPGQLGVYHVLDEATRKPLAVEAWTLVGRVTSDTLAGANRVHVTRSYACVGSSLTPTAPRSKTQRPNVSLIDLSDPTRPTIAASVPFDDPRGPNGLTVVGDAFFAAGGQTILILDVSTPERPLVLDQRIYPEVFRDSAGEDDAHDLVYRDGHLYVTGQTTHSLGILRVDDARIRELAAHGQ